MTVIAATLAEREVGNPVLFRSLSMTPLIGQSREPAYLLMEEALGQGCARAGSSPASPGVRSGGGSTRIVSLPGGGQGPSRKGIG